MRSGSAGRRTCRLRSLPRCLAPRGLADLGLRWADFLTRVAAERGISGTPSVFVGGVPVPANGGVIAAAVAELAGKA